MQYPATYTPTKRSPTPYHLESAPTAAHLTCPQNPKDETAHSNSESPYPSTTSTYAYKSCWLAYPTHPPTSPSSTPSSHPTPSINTSSGIHSAFRSDTSASRFIKVQSWSTGKLLKPIAKVCRNLKTRKATAEVVKSNLEAGSISWWNLQLCLFVKSIWLARLRKKMGSLYSLACIYQSRAFHLKPLGSAQWKTLGTGR